MSIVFLVVFIAGLLLAVRIMMFGVERPRESHPSGERSFSRAQPLISTFAIFVGLVGYVLIKRGTGAPAATIASAAVGGVACLIAARLVTSWWKVTPEHDVDDERYVLQGHLAEVVTPIASGGDGEVAFEYGGERRVLRARSIEPSALDRGAEVVIERIEDDVAYVEPWFEVEKRL
ncbi:MAG TPA: hypothetical protein VF159_08555 [Gemmatimonadaceae bacterium]